MANSAAIATSFKVELMLGQHQFGASTLTSRTSLTAPTKDSFKAALFLSSGSLGAATTTYSTTSEVTGTGYTAGGVAVTNAVDPTSSGTTAYWTPSTAFAWTGVTLSTAFNCCELYNSTQGNKTVAIFTFGDQTVTGADFTLNMPANAAGTALIRIA